MALPDNTLSSIAWPAPFVPPSDIPRTPLEDWERGGLDLNDASAGVNIYTWHSYFDDGEESGATPGIYVGVPGVIDYVLHYSPDPPPKEIAFSFDTNMNPVFGWIGEDDVAWFRWFDPIAVEYVNVQLEARSHALRIKLDDVLFASHQGGITDTIIAYLRRNRLYYRQLRDRFEIEYQLTTGGFPTMYNVGMNELRRFQFARSPLIPDAPADLMLMRPPGRASRIVGFDSSGNRLLHDSEEVMRAPREVGPENFPISISRHVLTEDGQAFFFRPDHEWENTEVEIELDFWRDAVELRAMRVLRFSVDPEGRIHRNFTASEGESSVGFVEHGAGTSTYTISLWSRESGQGAAFSLVAVSAGPVTGTFTPAWNQVEDFRPGQLAPAGDIHFTDFGPYVSLTLADEAPYVARSQSIWMRWLPGTLPPPLRPNASRTASCVVLRGERVNAGLMQIEPDGSAEFWPLDLPDTEAVFQGAVRGRFPRTTSIPQFKGLAPGWQVTYVK